LLLRITLAVAVDVWLLRGVALEAVVLALMPALPSLDWVLVPSQLGASVTWLKPDVQVTCRI
jgi:hypothetical protein